MTTENKLYKKQLATYIKGLKLSLDQELINNKQANAEILNLKKRIKYNNFSIGLIKKKLIEGNKNFNSVK